MEDRRACIYARYSSANQTEQSIEGQMRVCTEYADREGYKVVSTYIDRGTSASKDIEKRTEFLKMIKDAEKDIFDVVIVYKLDRFSRSRYDSATYKYKLKKYGVQLISATENISDSPEGIILESVLEGMAEFYSAELSQKITRGLRESAYKHKSVGGHVPLGYKLVDKELVIDEDTAHIVREAFSMYAEGHSVADICRLFNAKGYKTSKGTDFARTSFSKMFKNEKYIGVYQYKDYRAEGVIPPIIDKELFYRVQSRTKATKEAPAHFKSYDEYILSGKLYCGKCLRKMCGDGNKYYRYYRCQNNRDMRGCDKRSIRKEVIEDLVVQDALSLLTEDYIEKIVDIAIEENRKDISETTQIPQIKDRIKEVDTSISNLMKALESGIISSTVMSRLAELEKEKRQLIKSLKEEESDIEYLDKYQIMFWLEQFSKGSIEDPDFRRMLIQLFIDKIYLYDDDGKNHRIDIYYNLSTIKNKSYQVDSSSFSNFGFHTLTTTYGDLSYSCKSVLFTSSLHKKNEQIHTFHQL